MVQLGAARLTPRSLTESQIQLYLADLSDEERDQLRAGVQSFQIVYPLIGSPDDIPSDQATPDRVIPERLVQSNILPFVLAPGVIPPIQVNAILRDGDLIITADITVTTDVMIGTNQRVFLLLNQCTGEKPASYIFAPHKRRAETHDLRFTVRDVNPGEYLVRVQVDGAESTLDYDGEQYVSPKIDIR